MTDNLVLGLAAGYHFGDVRPFLRSLFQVGFQGECVLFVTETTRDLEQMEAAGATVVPFERRADMEHVSYNAYRYFLYHDWLKKGGREFGRIFISDVRDVVFQTNPFEYLWSDGINCTLEDRRMTIGACPHNTHWIRGHQGEDALAQIAENPISCSGTTMADQEGMTRYLETMIAHLVPHAGGERMAGYDQGVHNVLLYTGELDATLHDNAGPIMTLGYTKGEPKCDAEGYVLNEAGERAHIVHQYDRKPQLFTAIRERFA